MSTPHQPGAYDPAGGQNPYATGGSGYEQQNGKQYGQPYPGPQYSQPHAQQYGQGQFQQGQFGQQRPARAPGEGVMGPFTVRDVLILAGAVLVVIGAFFPIYHSHDEFLGRSFNRWVWHWSSLETIFFMFVAPVVAGVLCLLHKLVRGFPKRFASFSVDQTISAVAIAGAAFNFLYFISAPQHSFVGSILALVGSLLVFVAASLTMIPAFARDFVGRPETSAPEKARPLPERKAPHGGYGPDQQAYQPAPQQDQQAGYGQPAQQYGPTGPGWGGQYGAPGGPGEEPADDKSEYRVAEPTDSGSSTHPEPYIARGTGAAGVAGTAYVAQDQAAAGQAGSYGHPAYTTSEQDIVPDPDDDKADSVADADAGDAEDRQEADRNDESTAGEDDSTEDTSVGETSEDAPAGAESADAGAASAAGAAGDQAAQGEPETERSTASPFWFAVPEERAVVDESGQPVFPVIPGIWFLALEDHGSSFMVRSQDGRVGMLHDVTGIQRG